MNNKSWPFWIQFIPSVFIFIFVIIYASNIGFLPVSVFNSGMPFLALSIISTPLPIGIIGLVFAKKENYTEKRLIGPAKKIAIANIVFSSLFLLILIWALLTAE